MLIMPRRLCSLTEAAASLPGQQRVGGGGRYSELHKDAPVAAPIRFCEILLVLLSK